ncbi:Na+/H+ antiporter NhaC [Marinococcus halophilus]|uniref:Na+/H+ antiporter NhaC n=1 Tax=Marinococcus halophilus TaxID=1371 RepID=A0A510Y974_MARHA|nr:Na+/H+ antiporter NhaC [Marinococcus halophilus]OZT79097.1 Na+/H+ antiporter NhaC [Marinococcus halophilus]GEK59920.1 Na+/H+ antiporter NhaC [Marinococcus halophilus]
MKEQRQEPKKPTLLHALIPILFMIAALFIGIARYGADPHIPLFLSSFVAAIVALSLGYKWKTLEEGMIRGISLALQAVIILVIIGTIIGSWLAGGIVPTMIFYGLDILSPTYFLFAACMISCLVAVASGNAWTAAGTIGIALMGIGEGLGVNIAMVAGAVISGIYFGDKVSPLSETTNLAPGVAGAELFEHIKHMLFTTVPALVIALSIYLVMGFWVSGDGNSISQVAQLQNNLNQQFLITPWLLIVPGIIIAMMIMKIPAIPALSIGSLMGIFCSIVVQGVPVGDSIAALFYGYSADTSNEILNNLLNNGGIEAMMYTVSLLVIALSFGGILEIAGFFTVIVESLMKLAKSTGSLISTTVMTSVTANVVGCEQYLSIIIPARMYAGEYKKRRLKMKNLSRTVEDAGTMTSPLVPWNTCGAFMFATLGVSAFTYAPYAFLPLLSPLMAILYGYTGFTIEYEDDLGAETDLGTEAKSEKPPKKQKDVL